MEITIPRSFDPSWSSLGLLLRREDIPRVAVARYYFWAVVLLVSIILAGILAWAILHREIESDPQGAVAIAFWCAQLIVGGVYVLTCAIGFRPAINIRLADGFLRITQNGRKLMVSKEDVTGVDVVSATDVHRHYARYRDAHIFMGPSLEDYLLLRVGDGVVVIGVGGSTREEIMGRLTVPLEPHDEEITRVAL